MENNEQHIIDVPIEYLERAKSDGRIFWQSYGSFPLRSSSPYFENLNKIKESVFNRHNPFNHDTWKFDNEFRCEDDFIRFIHVDLGQKKDACGFSMCHVNNWIEVLETKIIDDHSYTDRVLRPYFYFDFIARLKAPKGGEIIFDDIRQLIYELDQKGFPIGLITYDRFGSIDSIQILRREGYIVGNLSMDRTANYPVVDVDKEDNIKKIPTEGKFKYISAWSTFKGVLNSNRVNLPKCLEVSNTSQYDKRENIVNIDDYGNKLDSQFDLTWIEREMREAVYDSKVIKIHEPARGSIDLLESIAGSVFNASNNVTELEIEERPSEKRARLSEELYTAKTDFERKEIQEELDSTREGYVESEDDYVDDSIFEE